MSSWKLIFERQWLHAIALAILLALAAWVSGGEQVRRGELWGICTPTWFWAAIGSAVIHQAYVWFCWRAQLHASLLSRAFGAAGFPLYAIGFSIIGLARGILVVLLAMANRDTVPISPGLLRIVAVIVAIPAGYLFYSVGRYFGFRRAFGIDHFDEGYRSLPLVRKGIFRYTRNGMYTFGFLILWAPGLWWASAAALWVALFHHLYIWVHYHSTERPDMRRIYA